MRTNEFARFIYSLAEKSGEVIKQHYLAKNLDVEIKNDSTPVTQADREAEALMRELIRKTYPEHGIIGEEFGEENLSAEFVWTLDPIDGTASFAIGCPLFGTLIGLLYENKPVLGAIHQPVLKQLCIGDETRTTVNGRPVQLRNICRLSDAIILTTDIVSITCTKYKDSFNTLLEKSHLFRTWGDCYGYLLVASGKADIMLDMNMKIWDVMPLIPIIRGANGMITTWAGKDASQGASCLAANRALHSLVLQILTSQTDPA
jgi:myo-inositol-1(or 4)-monophosphatase